MVSYEEKPRIACSELSEDDLKEDVGQAQGILRSVRIHAASHLRRISLPRPIALRISVHHSGQTAASAGVMMPALLNGSACSQALPGLRVHAVILGPRAFITSRHVAGPRLHSIGHLFVSRMHMARRPEYADAGLDACAHRSVSAGSSLFGPSQRLLKVAWGPNPGVCRREPRSQPTACSSNNLAENLCTPHC